MLLSDDLGQLEVNKMSWNPARQTPSVPGVPGDFSENTACKMGRRPTAQNRCLLTRKGSQWTTAELGGIYAVRKQTTREGREGGGAAVGPQGGLKGKKHK